MMRVAPAFDRHDRHGDPLVKRDEHLACINCGTGTRYNRRVEHVETRRVVGGLCESCERARFGDALRTLAASESTRCVYCGAPPTYVPPEHVVSMDDGGRAECEIAGYFVTDMTPSLCAPHLDAMRAETPTFWPEGSTAMGAGD